MTFLIQNHLWIAEIALLIILLTTLNFFLGRALTRSREKALFSGNAWLAHLELAILTPTRLLLWILLLTFSVDLLNRYFELKGIFTCMAPIRNAAVVICFTWFLFRWKTAVYRAMKDKKGALSLDLTSLEIFDKVFTILLLFISLLVLLSFFQIDILPFVTFGGIGAAALGFASKDVIANFFGGLMLYVTRPFSVNDLIELPQKKLMGYIENIGWYFTSIRDLNKTLIYVPNFFFPTELVINLSRMTHRYLNETITVRHADTPKLAELMAQIQKSLDTNLHIDHHLKTNIHLSHVHSHGLDIEVKAYLLPTRYDEYMHVKQEILFDICRIMDALKIQRPTTLEALQKVLGTAQG